jgi:hypothetical protein
LGLGEGYSAITGEHIWLRRKKNELKDILSNQDTITWFAINRYHHDGKGHPISRLNFRGSARVVGLVVLVIGVVLGIIGFSQECTAAVVFLLLGGGALWIAVDNFGISHVPDGKSNVYPIFSRLAREVYPVL